MPPRGGLMGETAEVGSTLSKFKRTTVAHGPTHMTEGPQGTDNFHDSTFFPVVCGVSNLDWPTGRR